MYFWYELAIIQAKHLKIIRIIIKVLYVYLKLKIISGVMNCSSEQS